MHLLSAEQTWEPFAVTRGHDDEGERRAANRALAFSAAGLLLTGIFETFIAVLSGSVSLLGDALHNLSDVSTSAVVFLGFHLSKRRASAGHPYGYERAEDLAGLGVALVIWLSAAFAGVVSFRKLVEHGETTHLTLGMVTAGLGIVGNLAVARYKLWVGRRIQSATLVADAKHSSLDALSSVGALLGLSAVALGHPWGDPLAGFVVTAFIVHVGWEVTREIVLHLMDAVDPDLLRQAERAAVAVGGVGHAHVRGRWMGRSLVVEVEGFVDASLTVEEGELLGRAVEHAVFEAVPQIRRVVWLTRPMSSVT